MPQQLYMLSILLVPALLLDRLLSEPPRFHPLVGFGKLADWLESHACSIQNLWLAIRAENLGMGSMSMFDPLALAEWLSLPVGSKPIAILCIGQVEAFYPAPMLELEGWRQRVSLKTAWIDDGGMSREFPKSH